MADKDFNVRKGLNVSNGFLTVNTTSGRIGVNTATPLVTFDVRGSDAIQVTVGNTTQRPTGSLGLFRYNSELDQFEGYTNAEGWGQIGGIDITVPGSNTGVVYSNSGSFYAATMFTYDPTSGNVNVGNNFSVANTIYVANIGAVVVMANTTTIGAYMNSSAVRVGNSSVNSTINSTAVSAGKFTGNGVMQDATSYWQNTAGVVVTTDKINAAGVYQTITDSATPSWSMADGIFFQWDIGAARQLPLPSVIIEGRTCMIKVKPTGNYAMTYATGYVFDSDSAPPIANSTGKSTFLSIHGLPGGKCLLTIPAKGVTV